jgi:2-succinyl-5-enolpyruvyl-6-hydroxy-3-cyclohexene-1-carboxylate synthase
VHLNLPFREPLVSRPGTLPAGRAGGRPWHEVVPTPPRADHAALASMAARVRGRTGVVIAGGGIERAEGVLVLAHTLGWPVFADPRSGCRVPDPAVVAHADAVLRAADPELRPEVVLRLGAPPASRVLAEWVVASGATEVVVDAVGGWSDPSRRAAAVVVAEPGRWCLELAAACEGNRVPSPWASRWREAERAAAAAIAGVLARHPEPTEPAVARDVLAALPAEAALVVSSSMPIRDLEWYAVPREGVRVLANRGVNGIDGVVSTAVGVALAGGPTAALVGDLAFVHDTNALVGLARRGVDLVVVVVHNDGGGIFSFLPAAGLVPADRFELLFGTPHGVDPMVLAAAHGVPATAVTEQAALRPAVARAVAAGGVHVLVVRTDRAANVALHRELHDAVADAVSSV